jgi:hypothetical protein
MNKSMNRTQLKLDAATGRRLAVEASCDTRTIIRALRGEKIRGLAGYRAREVLARHGLIPPSECPFEASPARKSQ